jgi:dephospho-CoA kinase
MSLILITGLPGTGKTTICHELKGRGFIAYDADEDGLAHWYNNHTGLEIKVADEARTPEFVSSHLRNIPLAEVKRLAEQAKDGHVYLSGDPENEDELRYLFEKVYAVTVDETIRQQRLAARTNNTWGKLPHERERDLIRKQESFENYRKYGYILVDGTLTASLIVDQLTNDKLK